MADELKLKWGTLKGWNLETDKALEALHAYSDTGHHSLGAMTQRDTPEMKEKLCALIDAVAEGGGTITSDWTGETMTADEAKAYVRDYGKR
ncbi:hypothetical protein [uncultured Alsobacter sp.]|uniref:hypothetical protein n=1 Tax=uncultured Alsobacter sp. TaxID=1748258 RepID=UPI0025E07E52|nr:hypothetical protein [uncultured Alsobacter sp.]